MNPAWTQMEETVRYLVRVRRPPLALERAKALVAAAPEWPDAFVVLALARFASEDPEGALDAARHALRLDPTHGGALLMHGRLLLRQDPALALEAAVPLLAHHPDQPLAHVLMADVLTALGRGADALRHRQRALALEPTSPELLVGLAEGLDWRTQPDQVEAALRDALRTDPLQAQALQRLGELAIQRQDPAAAIGFLRASLRLEPNNATVERAVRALELVPQESQQENPRLAEMQRAMNAWVAEVTRRPPPPGGARLNLNRVGEMLELHGRFLVANQDRPILWDRSSFADTKFEFFQKPLADLYLQAVFIGYTLDRLTLPEADLRYANLSRTTLSGNTITGARLDDAKAVMSQLVGNHWIDCSFNNFDLTDSRLQHERFEGCTGGIDLESCTVSGCAFLRCDWPRASFPEARFEGCTFEGGALGDSVRGATFVGCTFRDLTFAPAGWAKVRFEDCRFEGCARPD